MVNSNQGQPGLEQKLNFPLEYWMHPNTLQKSKKGHHFLTNCKEALWSWKNPWWTEDRIRYDLRGRFWSYCIYILLISISLADIKYPYTIPFWIMKQHFYQLSIRFVSLQHCNTSPKWLRQSLNEVPKTKKSSINTSIMCTTMSEKINIIQCWNVVRALHNLNGIRL